MVKDASLTDLAGIWRPESLSLDIYPDLQSFYDYFVLVEIAGPETDWPELADVEDLVRDLKEQASHKTGEDGFTLNIKEDGSWTSDIPIGIVGESSLSSDYFLQHGDFAGQEKLSKEEERQLAEKYLGGMDSAADITSAMMNLATGKLVLSGGQYLMDGRADLMDEQMAEEAKAAWEGASIHLFLIDDQGTEKLCGEAFGYNHIDPLKGSPAEAGVLFRFTCVREKEDEAS